MQCAETVVSVKAHGVSPTTYLTRPFGAFVTASARLVRSTVRPLLIPVPGRPSIVQQDLQLIRGRSHARELRCSVVHVAHD